MIKYLVLIIIIFYFIITSIEDIKKREVYDYLNFSLSYIVFIIALVHSFIINNFEPLKFVSFGFLIGFAIGLVLYYLGIWGGGDAKFLIGFSGSSYYLINFVNNNSFFNNLILNLFYKFSLFSNLFVDYLLKYILILDFLFILIIISSIFYFNKKNKLDRKNAIYLLYILILFFIGLYYNFANYYLLFIAFIIFILIFFAEESLFQSIYFTIKKNTKYLKEHDRIVSNIYFEKKKVIDYENSKFGITKEDLIKINNNILKSFDIKIKKVLPLSSLLVLNFSIYLIKIITLNKTNLLIISFLIKFIIISFLIGGILAIFLIFYYYMKNFKKIKIKFLRIEKIFILPLSLSLLILSFLKIQFLLILSLIGIFYLIKIGKKVERYIFVSKKDINKIVLGDWISQDIKIDKKIIYSINDFKLGINEIQLENLKKLSKTNNNLKKIYVKDGLPFLPPLFIGFIIIILI